MRRGLPLLISPKAGMKRRNLSCKFVAATILKCLRAWDWEAHGCATESNGINRAHMVLDGVGNACRMRQRAHMTGVGNLVIAGME